VGEGHHHGISGASNLSLALSCPSQNPKYARGGEGVKYMERKRLLGRYSGRSIW